MSKPTQRQKEVIELLKRQCDYWLTTNDIHSPSHATDIESELSNMTIDGTISDYECSEMSERFCEVLTRIASLDPCAIRSSHGG